MSDPALIALFAALPSIIAALVAGYIAIREKGKRMRADSRAKSFEEISDVAIGHLETVAGKRGGKCKPKKLAAVIPEHNSPTTKKQREDASLQTMRARLVASTLALDLPARNGQPATDDDE